MAGHSILQTQFKILFYHFFFFSGIGSCGCRENIPVVFNPSFESLNSKIEVIGLPRGIVNVETNFPW